MLTTFLVTVWLTLSTITQAGPIIQSHGLRDELPRFKVLAKRDVSAPTVPLNNSLVKAIKLSESSAGDVKASSVNVPGVNIKQEHLKADILGRPLVGKFGLGIGGGIAGGIGGGFGGSRHSMW